MPKQYTTSQLALEVGVARDTIYRWAKAGKIKASGVVVGSGRNTKFKTKLWTEDDKRAIQQWIKIKNRGIGRDQT